MTRLGIKLRSIARRVGLLALIQPMFRGRTYEEEFGNAMLGEVRPGDVVWDVGANVGLYTRKFIDKVGPSGRWWLSNRRPRASKSYSASALPARW